MATLQWQRLTCADALHPEADHAQAGRGDGSWSREDPDVGARDAGLDGMVFGPSGRLELLLALVIATDSEAGKGRACVSDQAQCPG